MGKNNSKPLNESNHNIGFNPITFPEPGSKTENTQAQKPALTKSTILEQHSCVNKLPLFTFKLDQSNIEMITPPRTAKNNYLIHHSNMDYYPKYIDYLVNLWAIHRINEAGLFYRGIPCEISCKNEIYTITENF